MDSNELTANLYFAAAVRVAADVSLTRLLPLGGLKEPLSPHENFSHRMLLSLQALGIIEPELSIANAEDWLTARDWIALGWDTLAWRIRWAPRDDRHRVAMEMLKDIEPSESTLEALLIVWEDLALAEVAQYASWALARSSYNPQWVALAIEPLRDALKSFSVDQVMYLIHIALRSVTATHQHGGIAAGRLGDVFSDAVSSFTRRAIHEQWLVRGMSRPRDLPMSTISTLFAHEVARLDDEYLTRVPSLIVLSDAMTRQRSVH